MMLQPLLKKTETERLFKMLFSEERFPSSSLQDAVSNDWKKFWIIFVVDFLSIVLIFDPCFSKETYFWLLALAWSASYWIARFFTGQPQENIMAIKAELMKNVNFTNLATSLQSDYENGNIVPDACIRNDKRYIRVVGFIRQLVRSFSHEETLYPHPTNEQ